MKTFPSVSICKNKYMIIVFSFPINPNLDYFFMHIKVQHPKY